MSDDSASASSRGVALLLCALCCFLLCGMHRLYVGRRWSGLLWVATLGFLGIGQLMDLMLILVGRFRDREALPLTRW